MRGRREELRADVLGLLVAQEPWESCRHDLADNALQCLWTVVPTAFGLPSRDFHDNLHRVVVSRLNLGKVGPWCHRNVVDSHFTGYRCL